MDNQSLTPTQKKILKLMKEHRFAIFGPGHRDGLRHSPIGMIGVMITGYQTPQYFLKARGLIEPVPKEDEPDSRPGRSGQWTRLTADGLRRAEKL